MKINQFDYQFDLVCDRSDLASLTQSYFMSGYLVSGLVFSYYSDKYGRRPVVWLSFTLEILALLSCSLSVNITQYSISRFLNGVGASGRWLAMYTIREFKIKFKYFQTMIICLIQQSSRVFWT
jgi:MFS family permease